MANAKKADSQIEKQFLAVINSPETTAALVSFLEGMSELKKEKAIELALESVFDDSRRVEAARMMGQREAYRELRDLFNRTRKVAK